MKLKHFSFSIMIVNMLALLFLSYQTWRLADDIRTLRAALLGIQTGNAGIYGSPDYRYSYNETGE